MGWNICRDKPGLTALFRKEAFIYICTIHVGTCSVLVHLYGMNHSLNVYARMFALSVKRRDLRALYLRTSTYNNSTRKFVSTKD